MEWTPFCVFRYLTQCMVSSIIFNQVGMLNVSPLPGQSLLLYQPSRCGQQQQQKIPKKKCGWSVPPRVGPDWNCHSGSIKAQLGDHFYPTQCLRISKQCWSHPPNNYNAKITNMAWLLDRLQLILDRASLWKKKKRDGSENISLGHPKFFACGKALCCVSERTTGVEIICSKQTQIMPWNTRLQRGNKWASSHRIEARLKDIHFVASQNEALNR